MPDLVLRSVTQPGDTVPCDVQITGGVITKIVPADTPTDAPSVDLAGRTLIPGLWD